jgi:hypothetical protein
METRLIQEYRIKSAEMLGFKFIEREPFGPDRIDKEDGEWMWFHNWFPDQNADQMLMVWEYLSKQGYRIHISTGPAIDMLELYYDRYKIFEEIDWNSIFDATMKAFMEYVKSTEK